LNILDALRGLSSLEESAVFFLHYIHCRWVSVDRLGGDWRGYRVSPCGELQIRALYLGAFQNGYNIQYIEAIGILRFKQTQIENST
jgi:hypothetical protein